MMIKNVTPVRAYATPAVAAGQLSMKLRLDEESGQRWYRLKADINAIGIGHSLSKMSR